MKRKPRNHKGIFKQSAKTPLLQFAFLIWHNIEEVYSNEYTLYFLIKYYE